jgi:Retroviral aspartyl protease
MKKIFYLTLIFSLSCCTVIQQLSKQKITSKKGSANILFVDNYPLITMKIDGVETNFLFDTGAGISVLTDSTIVPNFENKKIGYLGSAKGADRRKIKNKFLTVRAKNEIFESENKILTFISSKKNSCSKSKQKYSGILGMDFFFEDNFGMKLDFSNNKIYNLDKKELSCLTTIKTDYNLIKSECRNSQIFIYLKIEGIEYKFKLDTGYSGNIIMPNSKDLIFKSSNKIELEGSLYQTISAITKGKEIYYEKMPVSLGNETLESKISVSGSIKAQNVGIGFIKGFDWIIDYNNNKVYIKRNQNEIPNKFDRTISYYAKANNDGLYITIKEKMQTKHNLGDQIVNVNNIKVTQDNICEMQDLLNKTEDWNTLNLVTIPAVK